MPKSFTDVFFLKRVVFFITVGIHSAAYAQVNDYFKRLEMLSSEASPKALVDSINAIPYPLLVSDFLSSAAWLQRSTAIATSQNYFPGMAASFGKLGTVKYLQGAYDSSVYYNLKAIHLYDSMNMEVPMAELLCSQGYQMKRRDLDRAFTLYRTGLAILEYHNAETLLTAAYDNFGVLFEYKNDLDSAAHFYQKALKLKDANQDTIGIPYSLNNLGLIAILNKNFDGAKEYFDRAFAMRNHMNDTFGIAESKSYYGDLYRQWQKWDEAIEWYLESNVDSERLKYPRQLQYNFEQLSICYENAGRPGLALTAMRRGVAIKDELQTEANSKTIIEMEQRYQVAEKDKNISRLEKEVVERHLLIYIITSILVIILLAALLLNIYSRRAARTAKDAAIIAEREAGLVAVFDATEEDRKRIAKDLHDGIGQQLSGLRMSWEGLEERIEKAMPAESERLKMLSAILDDACKEVRVISHTMMPRSLQERGLLSAVEDLLKKSLGLTDISFRVEHFKVEGERFNERIELSLYRICQELINNIIKHSGATEVVVQLIRNKNHLLLIMDDNGSGFHKEDEKDGMGLLNISSRIHTINGEVIWEPGPESGTVATLRVPLN